MWEAKGFASEGNLLESMAREQWRTQERVTSRGKGLRNLSQGGFTGAKVSPNLHGTLHPLLADGLTRSKDSTSQEDLFRTTINRNPNSNSEAKF